MNTIKVFGFEHEGMPKCILLCEEYIGGKPDIGTFPMELKEILSATLVRGGAYLETKGFKEFFEELLEERSLGDGWYTDVNDDLEHKVRAAIQLLISAVGADVL